jgi:hypothetical protein
VKHSTVKVKANTSRKHETAIAPALLENPKQGLNERRGILVVGVAKKEANRASVISEICPDVSGVVGLGGVGDAQ